MKHSTQPIRDDGKGVLRFERNPIVCFLLYSGPFDLNDLAGMNFDTEDWEHFAQLIGYSLDSWGTLSYVSDVAFTVASAMSEGRSATIALEEHIKALESQRREAILALGGEVE